MPGTTTKARSNGRLITREDLQAAYAQVMGEGEATARAAAPRGLAIAGAVGILRRDAGLPGRSPARAAPSPPSSRSGGSDMDVLLRRFLRAGVRRGRGRQLVLVPAGRCHLLLAPRPERPGSAVSTVTVSPGEQVLITVRDRDDAPSRQLPDD